MKKRHLTVPNRRCMAIMAAKPHLLLTWVKRGRNDAGKIIEAAKGGRTEMTGGDMHVVYSS